MTSIPLPPYVRPLFTVLAVLMVIGTIIVATRQRDRYPELAYSWLIVVGGLIISWGNAVTLVRGIMGGVLLLAGVSLYFYIGKRLRQGILDEIPETLALMEYIHDNKRPLLTKKQVDALAEMIALLKDRTTPLSQAEIASFMNLDKTIRPLVDRYYPIYQEHLARSADQ